MIFLIHLNTIYTATTTSTRWPGAASELHLQMRLMEFGGALADRERSLYSEGNNNESCPGNAKEIRRFYQDMKRKRVFVEISQIVFQVVFYFEMFCQKIYDNLSQSFRGFDLLPTEILFIPCIYWFASWPFLVSLWKIRVDGSTTPLINLVRP